MKTVEMKCATAPLASYAKEAAREPIVLTRDGKPIAALVFLEGTDLETLAMSTHPGFLELIERSRSGWEARGGLSASDLRRKLKL